MAKKGGSGDRLVGSRLRLRRRQSAKSPAQLAEILNVGAEEIEKYESGALRLGPDHLATASRALSTPLSYFFAGLASVSTSHTAAPAAEELASLPGAAELLSAYSRIGSSQLRGAFLKMAQRLAHESRGCGSLTLAKTPRQSRHSNTQAG